MKKNLLTSIFIFVFVIIGFSQENVNYNNKNLPNIARENDITNNGKPSNLHKKIKKRERRKGFEWCKNILIICRTPLK